MCSCSGVPQGRQFIARHVSGGKTAFTNLPSPVRDGTNRFPSGMRVVELTLDLLSNPAKDFNLWNDRAGGRSTPKVAAIVMTMVGSNSRIRSTPDSASRMYVGRALAIAEKYPQLFDKPEPSDAFVITDDFVSAGRISGAKSIPISRLKVGSFHSVEGKRLQVNDSATRYQKELAYLVSVL
jgi:chromosome partitioning protein